MAKQAGYLAGMLASWLFYKVLSWGFGVEDHARQVYLLHWPLLLTELLIIWLLLRSFEKVEKRTA
jgi:hypothetical protein